MAHETGAIPANRCDAQAVIALTHTSIFLSERCQDGHWPVSFEPISCELAAEEAGIALPGPRLVLHEESNPWYAALHWSTAGGPVGTRPAGPATKRR
jgi:hypothetical protein